MGSCRVLALALLLVAASCTAEVVAPRSADPSPTASPAATLAGVRDAIYVRQSGNSSPAYISRIDASTGVVHGALPDGLVSTDRATLYRVESLSGATQTRVHEIDVATGEERRAFTIDGDFAIPQSNDGPVGLSADGRWLALSRRAIQIDGNWNSGFAMLNLASGTVTASAQFKSASIFAVAGIAPQGGSAVVTQAGESTTRLRIWDAARGDFLPDAALGIWDGRQLGFQSGPVQTKDGKRLYWLDAGNDAAGPFIRSIDLATQRGSQLALPSAQRSSDFEKYLLWSLALSSDGATLYAVNPALGQIDEVDAASLTLKRTQPLSVRVKVNDLTARLRQFFLPLAEAKRYIRGGALFSSDGRSLYAAGSTGIVVLDTSTLRVRDVWAKESVLDSLALTADGARLYAISAQSGNIEIFRTTDGAPLGKLRPLLYASAIVRIEPADATRRLAPAPPASCGMYAPPDPTVPAEIQHLKTSATVLEVTSPCTLRVRILGGAGTLNEFTGQTIILRATSGTTFASAKHGDLAAIGGFALRANDSFTLSFDSRAFPDGSYPLNFMNR